MYNVVGSGCRSRASVFEVILRLDRFPAWGQGAHGMFALGASNIKEKY